MAREKKKFKYNPRQLTQHLRELAVETETMTDEGELITRSEALAQLLWKKALGYKETVVVKDKSDEIICHKPEAWAIQMIYERMEGKAPIAIIDEKQQITAAEKISDLARTKLNQQAKAVVTVPEKNRSVDMPDNGSSSPKEPDS